MRSLSTRFGDIEPKESRRVLNELLTDLGSLGISEEAQVFKGNKHRDIVRLTDESLMIVQIKRG